MVVSRFGFRVASMCLLIGASVFSVGCGSTTYYSVTDPSNGKVFYTTEYKSAGGGSIRFIDTKTEAEITLQSSEVRTLSKQTYDEELKKS